MSVSNGQIANQTTFNNAFVSRTVDDSTIGKKDLQNTDVASGGNITNVQRELNKLNSFLGSSPNTPYNTVPTWANTDVGTSVDTTKQRADVLTAEFNSSSGHAHTGAAGEGAPVSSLNLASFNKYFSEWQETSFVGANGTSDDVSSALTGKTSGGGVSAAGVPTSAPYNNVELRTSPAKDQIEEPGGKKVYGRLTESAGVWTLSFYYLNGSGVETAYSLPSQDIVIYFKEVFTSATRPTFGTNSGFIGSQDSTLDVVDATATQRGVVSTGAQSFGGIKTFSETTQSTSKDTGSVILEGGLGVEKNINAGGSIAGFNLSGTNTGDVSLGSVGSSPNANGATLTGQVLNLEPASGTFAGVVTTGSQTFAGSKTLSDTTQSTDKDTGALILDGGLGVEKNINAGGTVLGSNLSGTNSGDITLSSFGSSPNANGASLTGQALTLQPASSSQPGGVSTGVQTFSGGKSFAAYVAEQRNDVASAASITSLDSSKSFVKLTGSTATTIHGVAAGVDGQIILIYNGSTANATIKHQSGTASANDRIITGDALDISVTSNTGVELIYDTNQSRWVLKSSGSGGGGSGGGLFSITGSRGSPSSIVAGTGVSFAGTDARNMWFIQGSGGHVDITANPQIVAATTVGQELLLIGRSDSNTVKFENTNGLSLNGACILGEDDSLTLVWDGTNWLEIGRNA